MKKYLFGVFILIIAEIAAFLFSWYLDVEVLNGYDDTEISSVYNVEDMTDSINTQSGESGDYSCLVYNPTGEVVRKEDKKYNVDYEMRVDDEIKGYALVSYNGSWNVYGPEGKQIFKKDRIYNIKDVEKMPAFVNDNLIADYATEEYFDLKGNPVTSLKTRFDTFNHHNHIFLSIIGYFCLPIIVYLLWYFLFWRRYRRKNTLSSAVKNTHSILVLILSLFVAFIVSVFMTIPFAIKSPVALNNQYEVVESEDDNGNPEYKLLWYDKDSNSNKLIKQSDKKMKIGFWVSKDQAIVIEGNKCNVYGSDGKPVFAKDLENARLQFIDDGKLIINHETNEVFNTDGTPANSLKATIYKNLKAFSIAVFAVVLSLTFVLWFFLSWRRRKKD